MIISLFNKAALKVSEDMGAKIDGIVATPNPPKSIKVRLLSGEAVTIAVSSINGVWPDDAWDAMQHEIKGEQLCQQGHWHKAGDSLCGPKPDPTPLIHESLRSADLTEEAKTTKQKWMQVLTINSKHLDGYKARTHGLIHTFAQLKEYHETGKMPEYLSVRDWPIILAKTGMPV